MASPAEVRGEPVRIASALLARCSERDIMLEVESGLSAVRRAGAWARRPGAKRSSTRGRGAAPGEAAMAAADCRAGGPALKSTVYVGRVGADALAS